MVRQALVASAVLTLSTASAFASDATTKPFQAPAFSLKDKAGQVHTLAEFKGHVVLVDFWASWCAPCKASFPALDSLHQDLHADGLEVVAINVDEDRKDALAFLADRSPVMTVLFDPQGRSPEDFKVEGMPSSFLIDREGNVRFRHMGFTAQTKADFRREIGILLSEGSARAQH
jgi:DsbE subfamily thiol:disulfide oxidoreductase